MFLETRFTIRYLHVIICCAKDIKFNLPNIYQNRKKNVHKLCKTQIFKTQYLEKVI